jgi:hypothetical protein
LWNGNRRRAPLQPPNPFDHASVRFARCLAFDKSAVAVIELLTERVDAQPVAVHSCRIGRFFQLDHEKVRAFSSALVHDDVRNRNRRVSFYFTITPAKAFVRQPLQPLRNVADAVVLDINIVLRKPADEMQRQPRGYASLAEIVPQKITVFVQQCAQRPFELISHFIFFHASSHAASPRARPARRRAVMMPLPRSLCESSLMKTPPECS